MYKIVSLFLNSTAGIFRKLNGKIAFYFLCKVRSTHKDDGPNVFLDAAIIQKLHTDGYEATLYKWGNGSKNILFLHGWKSHSARWEPIVQLLDLEEFTCYAIDAPAHGRSGGDSINLDIYGRFVTDTIKDVGTMHAIVAHSLGALVVNFIFLKYDDLPVSKIVLTGAPLGMDQIFTFFKHIVGVSEAVMVNLDHYVSENILGMEARQIRLEPFFNKVQQQVLVIHDQEDRICDIENIKKALPDKSNMEHFFTKGLGHDLAAPVVYKRIVKFLN